MSQQNPASGRTVALLTAGLAVLTVGVFMVGGRLVQEPEPVQAAAHESIPEPTGQPTPQPVPTVTPSRNPRLEPDVDRGTPLGHDVFIEVVRGWTTEHVFTNTVELSSWDRGAYAAFVLSARPVSSLPLLVPDAEGFAGDQSIYGVRTARARAVPAPNRNIVEAASIGFTGRRREYDVTYSVTGECVRLRGAPQTNDISISICWVAYAQDLGTVRPQVQRMIASAARSI
ncbi:hypothetical protein EV651_111226 [Kribbella sp. VKM Ac-2571]|uniref:hypothetical protein n=1 Tax=Kribbella sp. VKM Ac-2571 TaxID=2512222 RepID=UPI0010600665|nr:hypothetical protein [Kribbella sp. VKM Ac-2571]TDO57500.1 hypothetical protein EV651_111226 [Kribbella sp. VKM Ac-2571]